MDAATLRPPALATPHQRLYVRTLLRELDLDTRRMTLFHRRLFTAAGLPVPALGADLEAMLDGMSNRHIRKFIDALRQEVPHA